MSPPRGPVALGPGGEFDLIRRFLAGAPGAPGPSVLVGPGDDCAVVAAGPLAISSDLSVEDIHFRRAWLEPSEIGYRAAAGALSDLAAVAARPIGLLASLALPESDVPAVAERVMDGVLAAASGVGAALLGGDVARSTGPLVLDIIVLGEAPRPVLRTGARPDDSLWVTGPLGAAAAAVAAWRSGAEPDPAARAAFAHPRPRIAEALWLEQRGVLHAAIDLSDGLAGDAAHLAAASGVRLVLELERVPVHAAALARAGSRDEALGLALSGGEDYELCFAASPGAIEPHAAEFEQRFGARLERVGTVEVGSGVYSRRADGTAEPLAASGYRHFERG